MTIAQAPAPATYEQLEILTGRIRQGQVQIADICEYCDALARMGLAGAVEDFFKRVQVNHPQWLAYQSMARPKLRALPTGVISWSSRQRRFKANRALLVRRWPAYESLFEGCEAAAARYQLFHSQDGNYQLRDTADLNPLDGWSGGLKDQKVLAGLWKYKKEKPDLASPVAFDGVGFGWLMLRVLESTRNTYLNYSPAVYVLEPDPLAIWMLLHMQDLAQWLEHPRLHLFLGEHADQQYRDFLAAATHSLPDYSFANLLIQRPRIDLVAIAGAEFNARKEGAKILREKIERAYASRTPEHWQQRFQSALAGGPPLKIIGITSRFTTVLRYSMEELAQAVRAAGHEFHLSIEADDATLQRCDLQMIDEIQPDLLIQISRMRWENIALPACVPFLCWDQDYLSPMRAPETKASLDALTFVAGHAAAHGYHAPGAHAWPAQNSIFCHPAAATHRYSAEPVDGDLLRRYACDFSFVSNASDSPDIFARRLSEPWQPHIPAGIWRELIEHAIHDADVHGDAAYWTAHIETIARRHGLRAPANVTELALEMVKISDRRFRHEALGWAADYCQNTGRSLKLFGSGWQNHPRFAPFACGPIEPGLQMRALFQATKINLQLILSGFIHSRSLDGLAAGGFFLTRHSPADDDPDPRAADFFIMARQALDLGIWNFEQLVAATDPLIAERRERFYVDQVRALKLRDFVCFHIAGELAAADTLFPEMPAISFRNATEFRTLADCFLQNDGQRRDIAQSMHQTVRERFSYDARLRTFLHRITRGFTDTP